MQRTKKMKQICNRFLLLSTITALTVTCFGLPLFGNDIAQAADAVKANDKQAIKANQFEPYYAQILKELQDKGAKPGSTTIKLDASKVSNKSDNAKLTFGSVEGKNNVLTWNNSQENWIEYQVDVPADGLYEMNVSYRAVSGINSRRPITWNIYVDGKHPFREASSIALYRQWKDGRPIKKDADGNDIRPKTEEIVQWIEKPLIDSAGAYAEPLQWNFTKGTHTLRLQSYDSIILESIKLSPKNTIKPYVEVLKAYPQSKNSSAEPQIIQAEDVLVKNDSAIQMVSDADQRSVPLAKNRITFNSIGGTRWQNYNQELTWNINIPESGKYKLGMRTLQNVTSQKAAFRRIAIDGKVPFQEFLTYRFPYATNWQGTILQDDTAKPYEIYLEKGNHTLSMAITHSPFKPIIIGIEEASDILRGIDQDLRSLVGGSDDKNRTYVIERDLPDAPQRIQEAATKIKALNEQMMKVNGVKDSISQGFATSVKDLEKMLTRVDDIPYRDDDIVTIQERITGYIDQLVLQPLQLDEVYVVPVEKNFPNMEASLVSKIKGSFVNFFYSFEPKNKLSNLDKNVLNVWVLRGRDYVNELQELTDEMFTPDTGIKVKVNLLPNANVLLLSNAANIQPDIALGLGQDLPIDYAIRNSLVDLSQFPDFANYMKQYSPGSMMAYYYNKGYYGVPETQSFQVLFYRKDILSRLGLALPNTWQDVYDLLPTLQQNYMNFYMPPTEYLPYFYQNNTEFYDKAGHTTALDTPQGFKAFKQWTDMFNIYALQPSVASFYQHFRRGDMPIGVADYTFYVQLSVAAPELNGNWGIAPFPGTPQADGTVSRFAGGGQQSDVIFKKSEKKQEAWDYLKWWNSSDVQERFGNDLESFNGIQFRWNTANVDAFQRLPWKPEDAKIITEQWKWYKEMPNVPGGYFLGREITNAWNRTVVDGMNYRSSLEITVMDVNRELRRKQQEFGFVDKNGDPIRTMDLPVITKPWEGVDKYAK